MKSKTMRIALAGNPNSGKTTLFNSLTGGRQRVGNYPGITVELGIPVILALNMMDEVHKKGMKLNTARLSALLGVPVLETVARTGLGRQELISGVMETIRTREGRPWTPLHISYGPDLDPVLERMTRRILQEHFLTKFYPARWIALKYLEMDQEIMDYGRKHGALGPGLESMAKQVAEHCQTTPDTNPEGIIADYRYGFITSVLRQDVLHRQDSGSRKDISRILDRVLTHSVLGPLIMLGVLYALFQLTFGIGEIPLSWVESFFGYLEGFAHGLLPQGLFRSMLVSGVIAGVGGVLTFVPLILIMFVGISILEDSGYMARMAYMLDRIFRFFGLHGSSIMPFIVSGGIPGGCAVPGVMAAKTLRSPKEKLATLLTAPFLSCGAKVPVFLLIPWGQPMPWGR